MKQRILVLTTYLTRSLLFSTTGIIYATLTLAYWGIFFPPMQGTPDSDNYMLVIGVFGTAMTFLAALSITTQANQAYNYPIVTRLESRVEYLTAVLLSAVLFGTVMQLVVALLALIEGPDLTLAHLLEIPPIWLAPNILAAVLAMHASDFVTSGWSRVYIFGVLAVFLFAQTSSSSVSGWLAGGSSWLANAFISRNWLFLGNQLNNLANWLVQDGRSNLSNLLGFVFWPFRAIAEAIRQGFFNPSQALAPAIILLYATILFMLAADFFATKDLEFVE